MRESYSYESFVAYIQHSKQDVVMNDSTYSWLLLCIYVLFGAPIFLWVEHLWETEREILCPWDIDCNLWTGLANDEDRTCILSILLPFSHIKSDIWDENESFGLGFQWPVFHGFNFFKHSMRQSFITLVSSNTLRSNHYMIYLLFHDISIEKI